MTIKFPTEDARRENIWLRMALIAPTGAGKTKGALEVATNLFGGDLPVAGIDTEHERMKLFADQYRFRHIPLVGDYQPEVFIEALDVVEAEIPGGVCIVDSFSHEWMGKNGVLQLVDRFGDWKEVRPRHSALIERMMGAQLHLIVCIRAKMKYEVAEVPRDRGEGTKQEIRKLGIGPIQDDAIIYEFDVVGMIDAQTHLCTFSNRCDPLVDTTRSLIPGGEVAGILTDWLSEGDPPAPPLEADEKDVAELRALLDAEGLKADRIERGFAAARLENRGKMSPEYVAAQIELAKGRLEKKKTAPQPKPQEAVPADEAAAGGNGKAEGSGDESGQQALAETAT